MSGLKYEGPPSVAAFFPTRNDVVDFVEFMIESAVEMDKGEAYFIPPVVYNEPGRVFNFDYNFIIKCLAEWLDSEAVVDDFLLTEDASSDVLRNGYFLVVGLLESYYSLARIKYKMMKQPNGFSRVDANRFYNSLLMKNGKNYRKFSAIPFSASAVKSMISEEKYNLLVHFTDRKNCEQVAFGAIQLSKVIKESGINPLPVTV